MFLTVVHIFWQEFGLKPSFFALHLTENGNVILKHRFPFHTRSPSNCSFKSQRAINTVNMITYERGNNVLKTFRFPLNVINAT